MEAPGEPARKRRKILPDSAEPSISPPAPFSDYIVLARARITIESNGLDLPDASTAKFHLEVNLRDVSKCVQGHEISVSVGQSSRGKHVLVHELPPSDLQILEDAQKLESVAKYRQHAALPLACAYATVQRAGDAVNLKVCILWENKVNVRGKVDPILLEILGRYLPSADSAPSIFEPWEPRQFYDHVHVPEKSEANSADFRVPRLESQLYPFQRRAVRWLLSREGVSLKPEPQNGVHALSPEDGEAFILRTKELAKNTSQEELQEIVEKMDPERRAALAGKGITRMTMHHCYEVVKKEFEAAGKKFLTRDYTAALPDPSRHQLPAGFVRVKLSSGKVCYVNHVLGVATTNLAAVNKHFASIKGGILADEMGLGKTLEVIALICLHPRPSPASPHPAGLRSSPATLIITPPSILEQWKDEIREHAQMVRVFHYQGVGSYKKTGEKLIDQLLAHDVVLTTYNVIAKEVHYVSEKPDRNLRNSRRVEPPKSPLTQISWWRVCLDEAQMVESGVSAAATVSRLIPRDNAWAVTGTPLRKGHRDLYGLLLFLRSEPWCQSPRSWDHLITYHRPLFREMLGEIAMRHSKDFVREDLRLPPQSRHTITIPFTPIEEQHYAQLFQEFCEDCGLDRTGAPLQDDWDPESPAIVESMRMWLTRLRQTCLHPEVGGRNRRALGRNTNGPLRTVEEVLDVMIDQHEGQMRTAQRVRLMSQIRRGQLKENANASHEALETWKEVLQESIGIVGECRKQYDDERASSEVKKEKEDDEESNARLVTLKARLRAALELQHIATFFIANAYFQLKANHTPEDDEYQQLESQETAAYEEAKSIRGELLQEATRHVNKLITTIRTTFSGGSATQLPIMDESSESFGGIESRKIFERLHFYLKAMNVQAEQFHELRKKMADFLSQALIDEDEGIELQGDEYESSTKHQDEMYAYMEALRAVFADRTEAINGQENLLIKQEMKQFLKNAKDGEGPAPELMIKLLAEREQKRVKVSELGCLRGITAEIRQMVSSLQWQESSSHSRASHELAILQQVLKHVQQLNVAQTNALNKLEQEVNHFRDTMNGRLDFYRALQRISDTVAPYQEENVGKPLFQPHYQQFLNEEGKLQQKITSLSAKLRYLIHMKTESKSTAPRICVICTDQFEVGSMTACGHQFCKEVISPVRQRTMPF